MNTYRVNIKDTKSGNGLGGTRIQAADKETAMVEAIKAVVRNAKAYNAKWDGQLADWQYLSENHADYTAWGVRKMPARQAA